MNPMSADEAEERIARIAIAVDGIWDDLIALYQGRAWIELGLPSWESLCDERMRFRPNLSVLDRRAAVRELTGARMSTRAIGAALGVSKDTVQRDQTTVSNETVADSRTIESLDGKTRTYTGATPDPAVIHAAEDFLQADGSIRAANLRHGFAKWAASIHRVHLFDPAEIAALGPDLGDGIGFSVKALDQWWAEYQTARRQGLRVIEGGNA